MRTRNRGCGRASMDGMASRRTTIILSPEDERLLQEASKREGISQSALIRKGIRAVTSAYRPKRRRLGGWLKLSASQRKEIVNEAFGDTDS